MNAKQNILRTFIALLVLAIFLVVIVNPTAHIDPLISLGIVLTLDFAAFAFCFLIFKGGKTGQFTRLVLSSALLTGFFVYILQPSGTLVDGYDSTFLAVFFLESASLVVAYFLGRPETQHR